MTGELFTARFADCHFDETSFPPLGGDTNASIPNERQELTWYTPTMSHYDPRTAQCETEVQRILDLQKVADSMPDSFTDTAKVTRSDIPSQNIPARLNVQRKANAALRGMLGGTSATLALNHKGSDQKGLASVSG